MANRYELTMFDLRGEYQWIRELGWSDDELQQVPVFEQATTNEDYINLADFGGTSLGTTSRPDASPTSAGISNIRNLYVYSSQTPRPLFDRLRQLVESSPTQSDVESAFGSQGGEGRSQKGNR